MSLNKQISVVQRYKADRISFKIRVLNGLEVIRLMNVFALVLVVVIFNIRDHKVTSTSVY